MDKSYASHQCRLTLVLNLSKLSFKFATTFCNTELSSTAHDHGMVDSASTFLSFEMVKNGGLVLLQEPYSTFVSRFAEKKCTSQDNFQVMAISKLPVHDFEAHLFGSDFGQSISMEPFQMITINEKLKQSCPEKIIQVSSEQTAFVPNILAVTALTSTTIYPRGC